MGRSRYSTRAGAPTVSGSAVTEWMLTDGPWAGSRATGGDARPILLRRSPNREDSCRCPDHCLAFSFLRPASDVLDGGYTAVDLARVLPQHVVVLMAHAGVLASAGLDVFTDTNAEILHAAAVGGRWLWLGGQPT